MRNSFYVVVSGLFPLCNDNSVVVEHRAEDVRDEALVRGGGLVNKFLFAEFV